MGGRPERAAPSLKGEEIMVSKMSRKAVPFTPFEKELKECYLGLVTNAGVHLKDQEPFDPEGDESHRIIPEDAPSDALMITHTHYDHADADRDINCVFPIDRVRELAEEGVIKGLGNRNITKGFSENLKVLYEKSAPEVADLIERSKADIVILTGG